MLAGRARSPSAPYKGCWDLSAEWTGISERNAADGPAVRPYLIACLARTPETGRLGGPSLPFESRVCKLIEFLLDRR